MPSRPCPIRFSAWIAKYAPSPMYTACPNDSSPVCPSSRL
jgi:hypothetical protein